MCRQVLKKVGSQFSKSRSAELGPHERGKTSCLSIRCDRTTSWAAWGLATGHHRCGRVLIQDIYQPFMSEGLVAAQFIQDFVSLLGAPLLVAAIILTGRGSARAFVLWGGLLVYTAYYYAVYAFDHVMVRRLPTLHHVDRVGRLLPDRAAGQR
jgi:hypothetical protein